MGSPNTSDLFAGKLFAARARTARAAVVLLVAHCLVTIGGFKHWRRTLGLVRGGAAPFNLPKPRPQLREVAVSTGRRVERAAARLPFATRCLPRAVATQWLLRGKAIDSSLVIAVHRTDRKIENAFHAWVEVGDEIVVGWCDRSAYRAVLTIDNVRSRPAGG